MKTSPTIGALVAALAVARGKMRPIPKDKTARVPMKAGGSYSYDYADLSTILDIVTPELAAAGLAILQPATATGAHVTVTTVLAHSSGEWMSEELSLEAAGSRPQDIGAAYTYARRYAVIGMLSLAPDEDVDGDVEAEHAPRFVQRAQPAQAAPPDAGEASPFTLSPAVGAFTPARPAEPKVTAVIRVRVDRLIKAGACTSSSFLPYASKILERPIAGLSALSINDLERIEKHHRAGQEAT